MKSASAGSASDASGTVAGVSASAIRLSVLGQSHGNSTAAQPTAFPGTGVSYFRFQIHDFRFDERRSRGGVFPSSITNLKSEIASGQHARLNLELSTHLLDQDVDIEGLRKEV